MTVKEDRRNAILILGVVGAGLFFFTGARRGAEAADAVTADEQKAITDGGRDGDFAGDVSINFEDGGIVRPEVAISPKVIITNRVDEVKELAIVVDVRHTVKQKWIQVAASLPIDLEPGEREEVTIPAFAFDPRQEFRGTWDIRGRVWDQMGRLVARRTIRGFYSI